MLASSYHEHYARAAVEKVETAQDDKGWKNDAIAIVTQILDQKGDGTRLHELHLLVFTQ